MDFISVALSLFLSNLFIRFIINILPIRKKRLWHLIIISLHDLSSLITYVGVFFLTTDIYTILYGIGGILGVIIAYVATLMIILDGVKIFKSRRLKEFERSINQKEGASIPKNIVGAIFIISVIVLFGYSVFLFMNFDSTLLPTLIGVIVLGLILLGLGIYFIVSGRALHSNIKAHNLMLVINLPSNTLTYTATITKELSVDDALGKIKDMYYLDEFGLLITPNSKYLVKGMKADSIPNEYLESLKMQLMDDRFDHITYNYKKYSRQKITVDNNLNIIKIQDIK